MRPSVVFHLLHGYSNKMLIISLKKRCFPTFLKIIILLFDNKDLNLFKASQYAFCPSSEAFNMPYMVRNNKIQNY